MYSTDLNKKKKKKKSHVIDFVWSLDVKADSKHRALESRTHQNLTSFLCGSLSALNDKSTAGESWCSGGSCWQLLAVARNISLEVLSSLSHSTDYCTDVERTAVRTPHYLSELAPCPTMTSPRLLD